MSAQNHADGVNIYDAKTQFSRLVARAESGEEVTITRNGRPVAVLSPFRPRRHHRTPGAWAGRIVIHSDFDELGEDVERDWYAE